ncbi:MAG: inositol phosphate phosphatase SopB [Burkholderiaceae bacterium]
MTTPPRRLGVSWQATRDPLPVNCWKTAVYAEDGEQSLFCALRHGAHDAYDLADPAQRAATNRQRIETLIRISAMSFPGSLRPAAGTQDGRPIVELPIVSVALGEGSSGDMEDMLTVSQRRESEMLDAQMRAYTPFRFGSDTLLDARLDDRDVYLRPTILPWRLHIQTSGETSLSVSRNRDAANNRQSLHRLRGLLEDTPSRAPDHHARAVALLEQVACLQNGAYSATGSPRVSLSHKELALRLPAMILLLAHDLGAVPWFNCGTGNDATAALDTELHALAVFLHQHPAAVQTLSYAKPSWAEHRKAFAGNGFRETIDKLNQGVVTKRGGGD